jgi:hypothetical protein
LVEHTLCTHNYDPILGLILSRVINKSPCSLFKAEPSLICVDSARSIWSFVDTFHR